MEQKLDFLRQYFSDNVKLIPYSEINNINNEIMPSLWFKLFGEKNVEKRIDFVLSIWKEYVGEELRNTISYLSEHLEEVELMDIDGRYTILYTIKTASGKTLFYEGRNPKDLFNNEVLEDSWSKIPSSIRIFYQNVHNGFYYYTSRSMGLVPLENVTYFNDDEWGIIEELEEPIQINLKTTFGFFKSGMGGYVAIDYNNCNNDNATLWWTNEEPTYNINFWDVVDEWIVIGFEV
ncbi:SMI1/KNR4 family protein [Metabacillus fastidiosus]|uniref:SMI1/KNR4 family protein n=1 Tax=Metabacillus fastidiosus TaxID=1458 RepID=UPI002E1E34C6|nr:SMI1/KNR4 family protein [Metabacillus fastidiosus]